MPATSEKQREFFEMVEHDPKLQKKLGISAEKAKEFTVLKDDEIDEPFMGIITEDAGVLVDEELSPNISITLDGFLLCENAVVARVGIQQYSASDFREIDPNTDGSVNLLRHEDEVFREETMASFIGKPICVGHPECPGHMITSNNWSRYAKGTVLDAWRDGSLVRANLLITDEETIKLVQEQGLRKLSCGYYSKIEPLDTGIGEQTLIIINHVALVHNPRAGDIVSIIDSTGLINKEIKKGKQMKKTSKQTKFFNWLFDSAEDLEEDEKVTDADDMDEKEVTDEDDAHEKAEDKVEVDLKTALEALIKRVEQLEAMNKTEEAAVTDEKDGDPDNKDPHEGDDDTKLVDEDETDGEYAMGDSFNAFVSKVEILTPGYKVANKKGAKRQVINQLAITDSATLNPLLNGQDVNGLSQEALDIIFEAAVALKKEKNNGIVRPSISVTDENTKYNLYSAHQAHFLAHNK